MDDVYKAPTAVSKKQLTQKLKLFDRAQNSISRFLKTGLILTPLGLTIGIIFKAQTSWIADILASSLIFIGGLLLFICVASIIPMTIWGLIQGRKDAKQAQNFHK